MIVLAVMQTQHPWNVMVFFYKNFGWTIKYILLARKKRSIRRFGYTSQSKQTEQGDVQQISIFK
jgi:hypothetical protein